MNIDFYYWGMQCPLNYDMKILLQEYEAIFTIHYYDIRHDAALAKRMHMYYPTLIIVDGTYRFYEPLSKTFLESLRVGELPNEMPYTPKQGDVMVANNIEVLDDENICQACHCTGGCSEAAKLAKKAFYRQMKLPFYGITMCDHHGVMIGGAEYVPTSVVPYDIPKQIHSAFITCVYPTDTNYDYKSVPLQRVEHEIAKHFQDVYVISDKNGTFPNGDLRFFIKNGYEDRGIIAVEESYCELHLLYKSLNT